MIVHLHQTNGVGPNQGRLEEFSLFSFWAERVMVDWVREAYLESRLDGDTSKLVSHMVPMPAVVAPNSDVDVDSS